MRSENPQMLFSSWFASQAIGLVMASIPAILGSHQDFGVPVEPKSPQSCKTVLHSHERLLLPGMNLGNGGVQRTRNSLDHYHLTYQITHSDQVRRYQATPSEKVRHNIPPKIRTGKVAVKKDMGSPKPSSTKPWICSRP